MRRFGEYLLEQAAIEPSQFEQALRSQSVYGGRIGTNLVELGYLVLEDLAVQLSAFHGVELPPQTWLEQPDPRALKLVPSSLVRRYCLLPLKLERETIHVAMLDPANREQLDFLSAAAGRPVTPYVLPEVRLLYWLETHCGIDRHPRYVNLAARTRQAGPEYDTEDTSAFVVPASGQEPSSAMPLAASFEPRPQIFEAADLELDESELDDTELLLEDIVSDDAGEDRAAAPAACVPDDAAAPPKGPAEVAALEAELQGAGDRDLIIELGLRLARAYARCSAVFVVRGGMVIGYRAEADGLGSPIEGVMLPTETPSIFARPALTATSFRGRPPHDGIDGRLLEMLGRPDAHEVLIQPIEIRGRVVNLLYADNGADAMGDTSVAALSALGHTMSAAYERLILERKRRG